MVREKLDRHCECFDILSRGPSGLQSAIPSAGKVQPGLQNNPVELRKLMVAVDTIKGERYEIITVHMSGLCKMMNVHFVTFNLWVHTGFTHLGKN